MLLSGPQCRSQLCHSALSACPLSMSMADQYVWGQQNTRVQRKQSLVDENTEMLCKIFITWSFFCQTLTAYRNPSITIFIKDSLSFFGISKIIFFPAMNVVIFRLNFGQLYIGIQIPQLLSCMITQGMTKGRCLKDIFVLPKQWAELLFCHLEVIEITTGVSAGRKITY